MAGNLQEVFDDFIMDRKAAGLSPATIKWYTFWSKRFVCFLRQRGLSLDVDRVTARIVREFIVSLQRGEVPGNPEQVRCPRALSPATINNAFRALRAFFNWAEREGQIEASPMRRMREPKVPEKAPPAFTREEIAKLLSTAANWGLMRERNYVILLLLLDTGIRLSELTGLTLDSVFLEDGYIKVKGKGSKERLIPIGRVVQDALRKYIAETRPEVETNALFLTKDGRPLGNSGVQSLLRRIGRAAGLKAAIGPHKFRHTFAREYLINGGDLESLRRMLGHTSLEMARRYVNLVIDDLEALHRKASPMDNLFARQEER